MNDSLRHQYLKEIGIQTWLLKSSPDVLLLADVSVDKAEPEEVLKSEQVIKASFIDANIEIENPDKNKKEPQSETIAEIIPSINKKLVAESQTRHQTILDVPSETKSFHTIDSCLLCDSRKNHLQVLSGDGHADADVFFICEAPTAEEEREGHYLTGEVQSLFNKMLAAIKISNNYFITALVKCHSFNQCLLADGDISNCSRHLIAQLEEFKPGVIVLLGSVQAHSILKSSESFNQLRNKVHSVEINNTTYQAIVSYHPAYLLRNPLYKKEALKDLLLIKKLINI